jgi:REase_AHJR-like
MTVSATTREQQRLREIAREYRARGYEVLLEPTPDQLPAFLRSFRIDMLARNAEENVIVEVRTHESLTDAPELDVIAQALDAHTSWRFELVVTNPKDRATMPFKNATSLNYRDIMYRLREARQLSEQEHGEAALLLAWSAAEALLRAIADEEAIASTQTSPSQLVKSLFTYGVLDTEQYQTLQAGLHARTMVVHGYKEQQSFVRIVGQILHLADQLLQQHIAA